MRNLIMVCSLLVILLFGAGLVYAGNVEETTNQSAEWLMTQNRNAAIAPDSVYFNPAGTALMADGGCGSATCSDGLPLFYEMLHQNFAGMGLDIGDDSAAVLFPFPDIGNITGYDADIKFVGSSAYYSFM